MKILDIGCGSNKIEGAIGLGHHSDSQADFEQLHFPFAENAAGTETF